MLLSPNTHMLRLTTLILAILILSPMTQAALFSNLEFGMSPETLASALKKSKDVALKIDETYIARMGLNGAYACVKPIAGRKFDVFFDYQADKSLKSVKLYDQVSFTAADFNTALQSAYKTFIQKLAVKMGAPPYNEKWKDIADIRSNAEIVLQMFKVASDVSLQVGIGNDRMRGYFIFCKFTQTALPATSTAGTGMTIDPFEDLKKAEENFQAGMDSMINKQLDEAASSFELAAEANHARAMWCLSVMYAKGTGVPKDSKKATEYNKKAAELGYAMALIKYGKTFPAAIKALNLTPEDAKEILENEAAAAKANCTSALYNLGIMYKKGYAVPKDPAKAKDLLEQAAKQGDSTAALELKKP